MTEARLRILFVNANRSATYGGVERWMIDAAAGMVARGHRAVLLGRPGTPWLCAGRNAGVGVRTDIHGTWAARVWRVRAAMCGERPDVVVVKAKKAARMAAWGRSTGAGGRVVLFLGATHELSADRWVDRFTWQRVDAGIVVARGAADWYRESGFGPREKLHVLWKGLDVAAYRTSNEAARRLRAELGLAPDQLAVTTVGRLAWQKGITDLFAAVRLLRPRLPTARFFVVGGGRDAAQIAAAAAAPDLGGAVTLLGQRDDIPALLAATDVFVQSSRREAMAQSTLEAMAAGRAVVSTRTIGADEAIEDGVNGLLVPVEDPVALADGILDLAATPERRAALGEAARRRVEEHFTLGQMLERFEAICRTIVVGRRFAEVPAYQSSSHAGAGSPGAPGRTSSSAPR